MELFTLHDSLLAILAVMDKQWHFRRGLSLQHCLLARCISAVTIRDVLQQNKAGPGPTTTVRMSGVVSDGP